MNNTETEEMSLSNLNFLDIPEDKANAVPCLIVPEIFTNPDLDVDFDDSEFLQLSYEEQQERIRAKEIAEQRAVAACSANCPMLAQCREWALNVSVFGVAGGLTQEQRERATGKSSYSVLPVTARGSRGKIRDDLVEHWTSQGLTAKQIAKYIQSTERTVNRARARSRSASAGRKDNRNVINIDRVSEETLAMYKFLADGAVRSRDDIIAAAEHHVNDETALRAGKNLSGSREYKIKAGRRKFLMNRLDIAVRRGRIHMEKNNGTVLLWLDDDLKDFFSENEVFAA